jgi:hypothetical protein
MAKRAALQRPTQTCACECHSLGNGRQVKQLLILLSYCNQDEMNDPSPDYEEYLACGVCGDNGTSACWVV